MNWSRIVQLLSLKCAPLLGFIAEMELFEALEDLGIPHVRAWEASHVDGAFRSGSFDTRPESHDLLGVSAEDKMQEKFLYFDVKTINMRHQKQRIVRGPILDRPGWAVAGNLRTNEPAQVYLCLVQNITQYVLLVPKAVWEDHTQGYASTGVYGPSWLYTRIPPQFHPFAVHIDQLATAVSCLLAAAESREPHQEWYRNPTTGVLFTGFKPSLADGSYLVPLVPSDTARSASAIFKLHEQIDGAYEGFTMQRNPFAPLVADFLIHLSEGGHTTQTLRIEHKLGSRLSTKKNNRSPFHPRRLWHFLILDKDDGTWCCFPRHIVDESWQEGSISYSFVRNPMYHFRELERLVEFIRQKAASAVAFVDKLTNELVNAAPGIIDDDFLLTSGWNESMGGLRNTGYGEDEVVAPVGKYDLSHYKYGLYWLCDRLNRCSYTQGRLVFLPLEPGHPWLATHVAVEHEWTEAEKMMFETEGTLPFINCSPNVKDRTCVVLRLLEMHSECTLQADSGGLMTHVTSWNKVFVKGDDVQQYLLIGCSINPHAAAQLTRQPSYLCYPSEFTTHFDQENIRTSLPSQVVHDGSHYWRREGPSVYTRLHKKKNLGKFRWAEVWPTQNGDIIRLLKQGSPSPSGMMLDFEDLSVWRKIESLIKDTSVVFGDGSTSAAIVPARYQATLQQIHQAMWDFGVSRRSVASYERRARADGTESNRDGTLTEEDGVTS